MTLWIRAGANQALRLVRVGYLPKVIRDNREGLWVGVSGLLLGALQLNWVSLLQHSSPACCTSSYFRSYPSISRLIRVMYKHRNGQGGEEVR